MISFHQLIGGGDKDGARAKSERGRTHGHGHTAVERRPFFDIRRASARGVT
jgi:hypothetical protein